MKQLQIENYSSINTIKLRQDVKKMQHQVLFSRALKAYSEVWDNFWHLKAFLKT